MLMFIHQYRHYKGASRTLLCSSEEIDFFLNLLDRWAEYSYSHAMHKSVLKRNTNYNAKFICNETLVQFYEPNKTPKQGYKVIKRSIRIKRLIYATFFKISYYWRGRQIC